MLTIDAQVHAYECNHPGRPWHAVLTGPPEVTGDQMVAAMDAVGVDGAILVSAFTMYRYDARSRGGTTEGADAGETLKRRDQDQRRLHAVASAISL